MKRRGVGTRPPRRVTVHGKQKCAVCGETIPKGAEADFFSSCSFSEFLHEWHCMRCVSKHSRKNALKGG